MYQRMDGMPSWSQIFLGEPVVDLAPPRTGASAPFAAFEKIV